MHWASRLRLKFGAELGLGLIGAMVRVVFRALFRVRVSIRVIKVIRMLKARVRVRVRVPSWLWASVGQNVGEF